MRNILKTFLAIIVVVAAMAGVDFAFNLLNSSTGYWWTGFLVFAAVAFGCYYSIKWLAFKKSYKNIENEEVNDNFNGA
ncbi:MAG: hypothetical protein LBE56_12360 [Tannerella sp.]|jgi:hypothetical protein|nr:hypothetical protein [Tannerella sp.]